MTEHEDAPTDPSTPDASTPDVRTEVLVAVQPDLAFDVFTGAIGSWWPLGTHSVFGAGGTVAFVDGKIVETSPAGETSVWGSVTNWDPPHEVAFTWHAGESDATVWSNIRVLFAEEDGGTRVTLVHGSWDVYDDPELWRSGYSEGWPLTLEAYAARVRSGASSI